MRRALEEYRVEGIRTTLPFFREVMKDEVFIEGRLDTGFIKGFEERRKVREMSEEVRDLAAVAAAVAFAESSKSSGGQAPSGRSESRWTVAARMAGLRNS